MSSALASLLRQANMAPEAEWSCPICGDAPDDVAYVTPCLHKFCLGCIVRWANRKSSCPLCRQTVSTILFSVRSEDDFLEMVLPEPSEPSDAGHQEEEGAADPVPRPGVAGFQPEVWAAFFQDSLEVLEPLLPWLNRVMDGAHWWEVAAAQGTLILNLCHCGLDEAALVQELQPFLQHQTVSFVRQFIDVVADRCREQILRHLQLLEPHAAEEQEDSPASSPGPAASPGPTPAPNPSAQEEPPEELGQAVAGPSAAGQGRDCSPGRPRRPPKRRTSGSPDSSAHKRPCRRQR